MKKMLIFCAMMLVFVCLAFAAMSGKQEVEIEQDSGSLVYTEVKDKTLDGYEPVYKIEEYTIENCDWEMIEEVNNTLNCSNTTYKRQVVDETKQGEAIYSYGDVKAIRYGGQEYNFIGKHCWVCGDYIACLSDLDGGTSVAYRALEFKCDKDNVPVIRGGESGFIKNLKTQEIIKQRSDVGEIG